MSSKKYLFSIFVLAKIVRTISLFNAEAYYRGLTWPYDNVTPFPYQTNGPVSIFTSSARVLPLTPIKNVIATEEKVLVENKGYTVFIKLNQTSTSSKVTGGPFFHDEYLFNYISFNWHNNYRLGSTGTIDDTRSNTLQANIIFHNTKYGALNSSKSHRDGVAVLAIGVTVEGHMPNPAFTPLQNVLKKIIRAEASEESTCGIVSGWLSYASPFYYAYPTSFNTGSKFYYSATGIFPVTKPWISIDQFEAFLSLRNSDNAPIDAVSSDFLQEPFRPLIQGAVFEQILK